MKTFLYGLIFGVLFSLSLPSIAVTGVRVIDGDTVQVPISTVKSFPSLVSIRLLGVNTPELRKYECMNEYMAALEAQKFTRAKIAEAKTIEVKFIRWDKYGGRINATVLLDGNDLSSMLIASGHGKEYSGGKRVNHWCN
jgi:endonuclease YncB( thermonuclease family)